MMNETSNAEEKVKKVRRILEDFSKEEAKADVILEAMELYAVLFQIKRIVEESS